MWPTQNGKKIHPDHPEQKIYFSKYDDSYLGMEGVIEHSIIPILAELEVTLELSNNFGYSPKHKKWFGWSHRRIYGFTIGSTCKPGNCHYRPATEQEELKDSIRFWSDVNKKKIKGKILRPGLIEITFEYRSNVETFFKYWFNYTELPFEYKLRSFIKYDLLIWINDFQYNGDRIKRILKRWKWQFFQKKRTHKILHEYDPKNMGRGKWTAETMEDARLMAIDYCDGVS